MAPARDWGNWVRFPFFAGSGDGMSVWVRFFIYCGLGRLSGISLAQVAVFPSAPGGSVVSIMRLLSYAALVGCSSGDPARVHFLAADRTQAQAGQLV